MATPSLSPNRALEKLRQHRQAVRVLAMQRAKKSVVAQLRAQGRKLHDFSAREINLMAEAELERNRDRFIAEAKQSIETWPGFARYRLGANLETNAQSESEPKSITSAVQMSGAK